MGSELAVLNGDSGDDSTAERLRLARELAAVLSIRDRAEAEYVDGLGAVGTGDKIEKYRRLLRRCLDTKDADSLDSNLDDLIEMMEEENGDVAALGAAAAVSVGGDSMDVVGVPA